MRVLFISNYPSPYRVDFFNLLGKSVELTVLYTTGIEEQRERKEGWFDRRFESFQAVFLPKKRRLGRGFVCLDVLDYLRQGWDCVISGGYSEPTQMLAFEWMRAHRVPFYMELDGGLVKADSPLRRAIKRRYISMPTGWLSSGRVTDEYLRHYGARQERIFHYPFSSLLESDLRQAREELRADKSAVRQELGIPEEQVVLAVGQFIPRKGFDILLRASALLPESCGVYLVGDEPTAEYRQLAGEVRADRLHFVGFQKKEALKRWYLAADLFAMPTREDIWGLVVGEAMSCGLPVVSTDRCVAALELVRNGENGLLVPAEDARALAEAIVTVLRGDRERQRAASLAAIAPYTVEAMAERHLAFLAGLGRGSDGARISG